MDNLYLIYVNYVGKDYKSNHIYEFIFCDTKDNIDGEGWDLLPASGRPEPPHDVFIKHVGRLESALNLDVIQDSSMFAVWDAVDGVIALSWENVKAYESYPEHRISFSFGETLESVEAKLYEKDLVLKYNNKYEKAN
jgi:hypothetical protein